MTYLSTSDFGELQNKIHYLLVSISILTNEIVDNYKILVKTLSTLVLKAIFQLREHIIYNGTQKNRFYSIN